MKVFYLFSTPRNELYQGYRTGLVPDNIFYGLTHMKNYLIEANYSDRVHWSLWSLIIGAFERKFGIRVIQPVKTLPRLFDYDIIFCHSENTADLLLVMKGLMHLKKPIIVTNISSVNWALSNQANPLRLRLQRFIFSSATRVIYYSKQLGKFLESILNIDRSRLRYLPFGVDHRFYQPRDIKEDDYILSVGKDMGRDYGTLLKATQKIKAEVTVVTKKEMMQGLKMPSNVKARFLIPFHQLRDLYAKAKFLVLPLHVQRVGGPYAGSDASGQTVLLDAMAMGKAVIVTRIPTLVDYVTDWKTGIFVEPYDVKGIREAIEYLIDNPREAKKIGINARKAVETTFNSENYARSLASVFWEVYNERK